MRCLLTAFAVLAAAVSTAHSAEVFRDLSYKEALAAAKKDGKIVLIDFYTTWCGPCKKLDKTTWKDKDVQAWIKEKAIALKIDAEKERTLAKSKNVRAYPTILLLKPDETEIDRLTGYRDAKTFLQEANDALAGRDSLARAREAVAGDKKNDPSARMEFARQLAQRGKNKEALEEYLWCFDHGNEHSMGFTGVRLSFLVSYIHRLGHDYPPAIKALKERRDAAEKNTREAAKAGGTIAEFDPQWFDAVCVAMALNRELGDEDRTLALFDELTKLGDGTRFLRQAMLRDLLEKLVKAKRYEDVEGVTGSLLEKVSDEIEMCEESIAYMRSDVELVEYLTNSTLHDSGFYFEVAVGLKKTKTAKKIAIKLLHFQKTPDTYKMLIKHALRADDAKMARTLARSASKRLSQEEFAQLSELLEEIPGAPTTQPAEVEESPTADDEAQQAVDV